MSGTSGLVDPIIGGAASLLDSPEFTAAMQVIASLLLLVGVACALTGGMWFWQASVVVAPVGVGLIVASVVSGYTSDTTPIFTVAGIAAAGTLVLVVLVPTTVSMFTGAVSGMLLYSLLLAVVPGMSSSWALLQLVFAVAMGVLIVLMRRHKTVGRALAAAVAGAGLAAAAVLYLQTAGLVEFADFFVNSNSDVCDSTLCMGTVYGAYGGLMVGGALVHLLIRRCVIRRAEQAAKRREEAAPGKQPVDPRTVALLASVANGAAGVFYIGDSSGSGPALLALRPPPPPNRGDAGDDVFPDLPTRRAASAAPVAP